MPQGVCSPGLRRAACDRCQVQTRRQPRAALRRVCSARSLRAAHRRSWPAAPRCQPHMFARPTADLHPPRTASRRQGTAAPRRPRLDRAWRAGRCARALQKGEFQPRRAVGLWQGLPAAVDRCWRTNDPRAAVAAPRGPAARLPGHSSSVPILLGPRDRVQGRAGHLPDHCTAPGPQAAIQRPRSGLA